MKKIDWRLHRKNCESCSKTEAYFEKHELEAAETVDARKAPLSKKEGLALAKTMDEIYVTKGQKFLHIEMKKKPSDMELTAAIIGPSGNLRAPAFRLGKTLIIGFSEEMYAAALK